MQNPKNKNSLKATSYKLKANEGFTLIELMVAIGVFSIVVGLSSAMFTTSMKGQEKTFTAQNVADSARYAMEMMSREIRMGSNFISDGTYLQFISTMPHRSDKTVKFELISGRIMFDDDTTDATPAAAITASNISVTALSFRVEGAGAGSHERITIVMRVESTGTTQDIKTTMDLQTTISPRKL